MNFLIIASSKENYSTQRIVKEGEKRGHNITVLLPDDFYLHTSSKTSGHDRIYVKSERMFKKDVDVIIPRLGAGLTFGAYVVQHWAKNVGIPTTSSAEGLRVASNKWLTTQVLSKAGLQVPKTTIMKNPEDFGFLVQSVGGLPCVAKLINGSQGKGVFILETEIGGSTALQTFANSNISVLLQQYIETAKEKEKKSDLRIWVVNGKVVSAFKRFSLHKDFRSNYSISKHGEKVKLTEKEKALAVQAAQALDLGCAGVDIMRDVNNDNKPYIIEINGNASLKGIETVTGDNIALEVIKYAEYLGSTKAKTKKELSRIGDTNEYLFLGPNTLKAMGVKR